MNSNTWMWNCWPIRKNWHQFGADTGYSLENLISAMDDKDKWQDRQTDRQTEKMKERERELRKSTPFVRFDDDVNVYVCTSIWRPVWKCVSSRWVCVLWVLMCVSIRRDYVLQAWLCVRIRCVCVLWVWMSVSIRRVCVLRACPWCNGYRHRNWTRRHEFKSWTDCISHRN